MLRYEFLRCMDLRAKIQEKIKGQVFVGIQNKKVTVSINACPTCKFNIEIHDTINTMNIDNIADNIYWQYRQYINKKFFIK